MSVKYLPNSIVHLFAWCFYALFLFFVNRLTNTSVSLIGVFSFLLPFVISFYLNYYCLKLFKTKGVFIGVLSLLMVFLVLGLMGYAYVYSILPQSGVQIFETKEFNQYLKAGLLGNFQFLTIAVLYFYAKETVYKERQIRKIQVEKSEVDQIRIQKELENAILKQNELNDQSEKLKLEHAFLRAQINPHFLHNTLNVLFSQALSTSPKLAENILKLSRIMRYSMESLEHENGCVSIEKELEHLKTLLEIHQLRFGEEQVVSYEVVGKSQGQMLPPLSIITVVENAFKYGDLSDEKYPLKIFIDLKPNEIYFKSFNKKNSHSLMISSNSIGMTNLKKRLDATFKDRYVINLEDDDKFYNFELTIYQN